MDATRTGMIEGISGEIKANLKILSFRPLWMPMPIVTVVDSVKSLRAGVVEGQKLD